MTKSVFKSKTLIVNLVIALAALYPPTQQWVSEHAVLTLSVISYLNVLLRLITKNKVALFASDK